MKYVKKYSSDAKATTGSQKNKQLFIVDHVLLVETSELEILIEKTQLLCILIQVC